MKERSRKLRRDATDAERRLWRHLRLRQANARFRRQAVIGSYIVDFVCFDRKLVIELDGGQHAGQQTYDRDRTLWLENQGFKVMRFWDNDVLKDIEAVKQAIFVELRSLPSNFPPSRPSPTRGEGAK